MGFDNYFSSSHVVKGPRKPPLPPRMMHMTEHERVFLIGWVEELTQPIGGWAASFDCTFGSGEWPGRRRGKRKIRRDLLVSTKRRGFDQDDALFCFRRFMEQFANHVTWFASVEPNPDFSKLNPGYHIHALLAGSDDVYRKTLERLWLEENGFCKCSPLRNRRQAVTYATKHVVRRGSIYAWKVNSTLWHHITEHSSENNSSLLPAPSVEKPFGWRKGRSASQQSRSKGGRELPELLAMPSVGKA